MIKRYVTIFMALLLLTGMIPAYADPAAAYDWTIRSPYPTSDNLQGVAYNDGTYVAVGGNGTLLTSTDLTSWTNRWSSLGFPYYFNDVVYGNGKYVAIGERGVIVSSGDGVNWTSRTSGTFEFLEGVGYGNGLYVAVGDAGTILTSADGENWSSRTSSADENLTDVVYGSAKFVAVGEFGTILTSSDGVAWSDASPGNTPDLYGIAFGNGTYVAVGFAGAMVTSGDGVSWTKQHLDTRLTLEDVTYGNGDFVAVGHNGLVYASVDGVAWVKRDAVTLSILNGIVFGNGTYLSVGYGGTILTSNDGTSWVVRTVGTSQDLNAISYGNGTYVAVGYAGTIMSSSGGANWTIRTSGTSQSLYDVSFGNGTFVAVGSSGSILTSGDGASWTSRTFGSTQFGVSFVNGKFVMVGAAGALATSDDGVSWTSRTSGTSQNLWDIAYGDGMYVAVGIGGTILTSGDLETWTSRTSNTSDGIYSVVYGNGKFMAGLSDGAVVTSSNGIDWTNSSTGVRGYPMAVSYGNGEFVAVGSPNRIAKSTDGTSWTTQTLTTSKQLTDVSYGSGAFVAVGLNGLVLQAVIPDLYTVTFDSQGGSVVAGLTDISVGAKIAAPANPTKAGFTFEGWYKEAAVSTEWQFGTDTVTANVTLYAKWTPNPTYTVTFDSQGGSAVADSAGVSAGAKITAPVNPTKAGFTFEGWYKEASGSTEWQFGTDTVTASVTLYAKWTPDPTYTVTFNSQGGSPVAGLTGVSAGAKIAAPANPTKAGFTFAGWYKEVAGATEWQFGTDTVTANVTLYAKWTPDPTYTVAFDSQGGSPVAVLTDISAGAKIAAPANPTKAGFTFGGWYKEAAGAKEWQFGTDTVTANVTLYAKWTPDPTYTVTFNSQGGSPVAGLTGVTAGAKIAAPANPTKAGFTFAGWYKEASGATEWQFGTDTVTANVTLYAKWTPDPTYTVTFDSQGGSPVAVLTDISAGAKIAAPANPTKAGFTFGGWYKEAAGATEWQFGTDTVTANVTLYAKWTPDPTYTVTFNSQGGSPVAGLTGVTAGAKIAAPANPTKAGFTFAGWYKEASGATEWQFGTDTVTANVTLYAKWTPDPTYTVTFDSQGGSPVAGLTGVTAGAKIAAPANPTKAGFTFGGWYKEAAGATEWQFGTDTVTAKTTLYAKWTAIVADHEVGVPAKPDNGKVVVEIGELLLPVGKTGEVRYENAVTINIPANATDKELKLTIDRLLDAQGLLTEDDVLASPVYEILKNFSENFLKPVTLTFAFDAKAIGQNQKAAVYYYDEAKKVWVEVGGVVNGNKIVVEVDHFTKYAVFAVSDEPASDIEFDDISGHWSEKFVKQAIGGGWVKGYADGTFKPNHSVTRAEFAVMLMNALKLPAEGTDTDFADKASIPTWAKDAVVRAVQAGIVDGYEDGTFRPSAAVTRAEMAAMITKALKLAVDSNAVTGFADDASIPSWAKGAAEAMRKLGIMKGPGDNTFNGDSRATRAEAVSVLLNMLAQRRE
ncbi:InlB B-repeat-containing protein [Paenibacillus luteus]|uniref:InlB B-repeat-containing protein n=1 Tax=Paenibacillus luteus TaxID=2545753 RepID=UPI001F503FB1|nr:InlB B-repeat-containing protein [Paenibacillus luteus]